MEAKDLRIGNFLKMGTKTIVKVRELRHTDLIMVTNAALIEAYYKDVYPIPLTPEILESCGFKLPYEGSGYYEHDNMFGDLFYESKSFVFCDYEKNVVLKNPIKYLHQLQNLYFALTSTELEVNITATV